MRHKLYLCPICENRCMKEAFNLGNNLCKKCVEDIFVDGKEYNKNQNIDTLQNYTTPFNDIKTGLMWEKKSDANLQEIYMWKNALKYVDELNTQKYGGFSDWRLPNISDFYALYETKKSTIKDTVKSMDKDYSQLALLIERSTLNEMYIPELASNIPLMHAVYWSGDFISEKEIFGFDMKDQLITVLSSNSFAMVRCVRDF